MGCCNKVGSENQEKRQFDPAFKGPLESSERHCRDCWMIPIWIAFWVGLVIVAMTAEEKGDYFRLLYGYDSFGNTCGRDNSHEYNNTNSGLNLVNAKKLMYFDAEKKDAIQLCVDSCPGEDSCTLGGSCETIRPSSGYCINDDDYSSGSGGDASANKYRSDGFQWKGQYGVNSNNGCPQKVYDSQALMNRCIPISDAAGGVVDSVMDAINVDGVATDFVNDIQKAYIAIAIICVATIVVALFWVFIMRYIAALLIWIAYYGMLLGSAALIGFFWYSYHESNESLKDVQDSNSSGTSSMRKDRDMWLGLAITWSVIGGLLVIMLLYLRKRIALVVQLFREASNCLRKMPLLLFYPLITLLLVILTAVYFGYFALQLISAGDRKVDKHEHVTYEINDTLQYMTLYHLFGFYWTFELMLALQEMVIAGSAATWYFTRKGQSMTRPILGAFKRSLWYHFGSMLLGALIIAIVKIIRFLVWYFEKQIKKAAGGNVTVEWVLKCINCCLWCCETCLKFLNRNAYIEIALYGKSFCSSAWSAFSILLRNALRVAAINTVGDFVLLLFKLIIVVSAVLGGFFYFEYQDAIEGKVGSTVDGGLQWKSLILLLIALFAYLIASMFLGVYEMVIDTIFLAFCEDAERNDGSAAKPYFMSAGLLKFMSAEERRAQKRTLKEAQFQEKKAAQAAALHAQASSLKVDPNASPESEA